MEAPWTRSIVMNVVESRKQREQRNTSAVKAPWIFVRDLAKLLLRSLCTRCAPVGLFTLSIHSKRFRCDSIIYEKHNHDASAALLALYLRFLCFYATLMATELHSAYYFPALKIFHNSILMFSSNCYPIESRRANCIHRPGPQEIYANSHSPDFCSLSFYSRPLQSAEQ